LYQLFEVIQFLKLLNPFVRGQFSLGQTLQVIAQGQKDTSPADDYLEANCRGHWHASLPRAAAGAVPHELPRLAAC
jgi:hypothetical protein